MKSAAVIALALTVFTAPCASGQALLPVETMNCEQMSAEMMTAGLQMKSQLDPNYIQDMQRGAQDMRQQRDAALATAPSLVASSTACAAGVTAACAVNRAQSDAGQARAKANAPRNEAYAQRGFTGAMDATRGLDMARMQALSARFEAQHCPQPH